MTIENVKSETWRLLEGKPQFSAVESPGNLFVVFDGVKLEPAKVKVLKAGKLKLEWEVEGVRWRFSEYRSKIRRAFVVDEETYEAVQGLVNELGRLIELRRKAIALIQQSAANQYRKLDQVDLALLCSVLEEVVG